MEPTYTVADVLAMLERQAFADFYGDGGAFDLYITGEEWGPNKQQVTNELRQLLESGARIAKGT